MHDYLTKPAVFCRSLSPISQSENYLLVFCHAMDIFVYKKLYAMHPLVHFTLPVVTAQTYIHKETTRPSRHKLLIDHQNTIKHTN